MGDAWLAVDAGLVEQVPSHGFGMEAGGSAAYANYWVCKDPGVECGFYLTCGFGRCL